MTITYLIDAYRRIEDASNREGNSSKLLLLESAIADIYLFGSPKQIELANKIAIEMAENKTASTDKIVEDLQINLRSELGLSPAEKGKWLRIGLDEKR